MSALFGPFAAELIPCNERFDDLPVLFRHLKEITSHMDLIDESKREFLGWNEIYMPIAFEVNPSKTKEQPRLASNRGHELMLRILPDHNVSLLFFLPLLSSLKKTNFNAKIYVPFPMAFFNRYYFMYYEDSMFTGGKISTFVHLRG